jgi:hypothetical protein
VETNQFLAVSKDDGDYPGNKRSKYGVTECKWRSYQWVPRESPSNMGRGGYK